MSRCQAAGLRSGLHHRNLHGQGAPARAKQQRAVLRDRPPETGGNDPAGRGRRQCQRGGPQRADPLRQPFRICVGPGHRADRPDPRQLCGAQCHRERPTWVRAVHRDPVQSPAALPAAAATQTAIEFGFRGPAVLHDGTMVRAQNHGYLVHMIFLLRAPHESTALQVDRSAQDGPGQPGVSAAGPELGDSSPCWSRLPGSDAATGAERPTRLLRRGLLHGHPGRSGPHPARDGAPGPSGGSRKLAHTSLYSRAQWPSGHPAGLSSHQIRLPFVVPSDLRTPWSSTALRPRYGTLIH